MTKEKSGCNRDGGWWGVTGLRQAWSQWLGVLYPGRCAGCRTILPETGLDGWCAQCRRTLTPLTPPLCVRCSLPVPATLTPLGRGQLPGELGHVCDSCLVKPPPQQFTLSCLEYGAAVEKALVKLKYQGDFWVLKAFAHLWSGMSAFSFQPADGWLRQWTQYVVPVPLHYKRLRERGYDQAALLARCLASYLGKPAGVGFLERQIHTRSQVGLSSEDRRKNVCGAFRVSPKHPWRNPFRAAWNGLSFLSGREMDACGEQNRRSDSMPFPPGSRILLVDDTMTTGATVQEAAAALLEAGAGGVGVFTIARAVMM